MIEYIYVIPKISILLDGEMLEVGIRQKSYLQPLLVKIFHKILAIIGKIKTSNIKNLERKKNTCYVQMIRFYLDKPIKSYYK